MKKLYIDYLIIVSISALVFFFQDFFLMNDELFYNYYKEQLDLDRIKKLLDVRADLAWINYALLPVIYFVKFSLITLWVMCGIILIGYKNSFKEIFHAVVISEFIWIVPSFIAIIWFGFINTDYTLVDIQYFKPLSLLNLVEVSEVESWLLYPLQSLNLFEVIYMFVLALSLRSIFKKSYKAALSFTIPVYLSALFVWIIFITFLTINLSV